MLKITEHKGYRGEYLRELNKDQCAAFTNGHFVEKYFTRNREEQLCFSIQHKQDRTYKIESTYMIGVDWIVPNKLPIYVQPKLNQNDNEIDYLSMLFEALQEPENFNYLEGLYSIDFEAPLIEIEQNLDKLTPLLLIEFLQLLKQIVRKGLKKSYYKVTKNLNYRVKGKILVNATVKQNHVKQKMLYNVCQYEEFGYNSIENKLLKKALLFTQSALNNLKGVSTVDVRHLFQYVSPAFHLVEDEIDIRKLKNNKSNPLFKEYTQALKLAKLILKKYGYNISNTNEQKIKTPPFWIDMSKLFELYVFKKLKQEFTIRNEVIYHKKYHGLELDYLLNSMERGIQMVIDAKYKPQYKDNNISLDDARQLSGYARLKSIYQDLGLDESKELIDCLIVYSDQLLDEIPFGESFINKVEDKKYKRLFKVGIKLPEIPS